MPFLLLIGGSIFSVVCLVEHKFFSYVASRQEVMLSYESYAKSSY